MFKNRDTGKHGEEIASSLLKQKGYRIITRNFKTRFAEIDIVALKDHTLSFVEVKTRANYDFGLPQEAVTRKKLRHITQAAQYFLHLHPQLPEAWQIDVVAVQLDGHGNVQAIEHLESVTS